MRCFLRPEQLDTRTHVDAAARVQGQRATTFPTGADVHTNTVNRCSNGNEEHIRASDRPIDRVVLYAELAHRDPRGPGARALTRAVEGAVSRRGACRRGCEDRAHR